jgi:hypothetical protein
LRQALCTADKEGQMAKYVQFITYKGKRILHTNAAGLEEEEFLVALEEMKQALLKEGVETLALTDVTGLNMSKAFVNKAKEVQRRRRENARVGKTQCCRGPNGPAEGSSTAVR